MRAARLRRAHWLVKVLDMASVEKEPSGMQFCTVAVVMNVVVVKVLVLRKRLENEKAVLQYRKKKAGSAPKMRAAGPPAAAAAARAPESTPDAPLMRPSVSAFCCCHVVAKDDKRKTTFQNCSSDSWTYSASLLSNIILDTEQQYSINQCDLTYLKII